MAFVAPKIIGGTRAPTPVGDLGNVEMTQAVNLVDPLWKQVGPDLMIQGYLPSSGGLLALESALSYPGRKQGAIPAAAGTTSGSGGSSSSSGGAVATAAAASWQLRGGDSTASSSSSSSSSQGLWPERNRGGEPRLITFYKAWDEWGALSNFSPHSILMPVDSSSSGSRVSSGAEVSTSGASHEVLSSSQAAAAAVAGGATNGVSSSISGSSMREWQSVEHYYQAQKFMGVGHSDAVDLVDSIAAAPSPEEAARIGRRAERQRPELVRRDWASVKCDVMLAGLRAKFRRHAGPRAMLLSTAGDEVRGACGAELAESSPHDQFWGQGYTGAGRNTLGRLLMLVREELIEEGCGGRVGGGSGVGQAGGEKVLVGA